jgi:hypothetical protein
LQARHLALTGPVTKPEAAGVARKIRDVLTGTRFALKERDIEEARNKRDQLARVADVEFFANNIEAARQRKKNVY